MATRGQRASFAAAACLLLVSNAFCASDRDMDKGREPLFKVSAGPWYTSGMDRWQTSFPICSNTADKKVCAGGSTLEYQDRADTLWMWQAEIRPHPRFSVDFQYADSTRVTGVERDHDWVDGHGLNGDNVIIFVPATGSEYVNPSQVDLSLSEAQLSGRTTYMSVNAYGRVLKLKAGRDDFFLYEYLDVSAGYVRFDDRYRVKDLHQIVSSQDAGPILGFLPPSPGYYSGLDSTFHFHWTGMKMGLRDEVGILKQLSMVGVFNFSPFIRYWGEGFWNLRTDFQNGPPSFRQESTGTLFEGRFQVIYSPVRFLSLQAGYMITYFHTRPGRMVFYLADGTIGSQDLDSAWSERKGWLIDAAFRF